MNEAPLFHFRIKWSQDLVYPTVTGMPRIIQNLEGLQIGRQPVDGVEGIESLDHWPLFGSSVAVSSEPTVSRQVACMFVYQLV